MRIPRIYTEQALSENTELVLEEAPSHHVLKVLRMQPGRELILFNGKNGQYKAEIISANKKSARIRVAHFENVNIESPLHSHLAIGISRSERFDFVLQKATELGVSEITPLFTERTEVKLSGERISKKVANWNKTLISACEQSGRCVLPHLKAPISLVEFLQHKHDGKKFVLHHRNTHSLNTMEKVAAVTFIVGPEGGLSDQEITEANKQGFLNLALGPRVLRTETAPLSALSLMQHYWGDV